MPRPSPLPPELRRAAFAVSAARESGVGEGRLRGRDLARPFHGIRRSAEEGASAHDFAPLLRPGERFSHATAAALWGAPLPARLERRIDVASTDGTTPHRGRGVTGHRSEVTASLTRDGLPVSDPWTVLRELATLLPVGELVAVGDHLVLDPRMLDPADPRPYLRLDDLPDLAERARGRGVRVLREAIALVRPGVESPRETALRLLLLRAGLPEPVCGYELCAPSGQRVGFFDLAWPERRVLA